MRKIIHLELTCAVYKLCVIRIGLNDWANICAAYIALIDCKKGFSCFCVVLSKKPLQVLETICIQG